MAGRPRSYQPYRYTREGNEYGNFRIYDPSSRTSIDLGTDNPEEAQRLAIERKVSAAVESAKGGSAMGAVSSGQSEPVSELGGVAPESLVNPLDSLKTWIAGKPEAEHVEATPVPPVQPQVNGIPPKPSPFIGAVVRVDPRKKKGLTPEQLQKISSALKNTVAKVNIVADELIVRLLGRKAMEVDEESIELLQLGWQLQLEEWFDGLKLKPWVVIVGANVLIVFSMWVKGEPIQKKPKPLSKNQDDEVIVTHEAPKPS